MDGCITEYKKWYHLLVANTVVIGGTTKKSKKFFAKKKNWCPGAPNNMAKWYCLQMLLTPSLAPPENQVAPWILVTPMTWWGAFVCLVGLLIIKILTRALTLLDWKMQQVSRHISFLHDKVALCIVTRGPRFQRFHYWSNSKPEPKNRRWLELRVCTQQCRDIWKQCLQDRGELLWWSSKWQWKLIPNKPN